jgi:methylenetetrahydrofolate--tRNA-(uracil-5-)-methyltransferase
VDREGFSREVEAVLGAHPRIEIRREEIAGLPPEDWSNVIVATGPLTSPALADALRGLTGEDALAFFDAIAPIVERDSIDLSVAWFQSRYDKKGPGGGDADYINCPLDEEQYKSFVAALRAGEKTTFKEWEKSTPYFEGCLPIEVMAARGEDTLRFGPMKPVGLVDPRTGREPYACVQLRQDNLAGDHFSLVGFQTQMKWGEQARVLRLIPGLENAEFVRFGMIHRNTYINGPDVLRDTWQTKTRDELFFAGQISGVEGYVESAASGLMAGRNAAALARGRQIRVAPRTTALGALAHYVSHANPRHYQPTNITFGIMEPVDDRSLPRMRAPDGRKMTRKETRKLAASERALAALERWIDAGEAVPAAAGTFRQDVR